MRDVPNGVKLRPGQEPDLQTLCRLDAEPELSEPFEWRGFTNPRARRRRWEQDNYLGASDGLLVVAQLDDTFAGIVNWRSIASSGPQGVYEIGILLLPDHSDWGSWRSATRLSPALIPRM